MPTKKFQFVVVVNSSVLFHRLPVYYSTNKDCQIILTLQA